jgi:hypothetical protein
MLKFHTSLANTPVWLMQILFTFLYNSTHITPKTILYVLTLGGPASEALGVLTVTGGPVMGFLHSKSAAIVTIDYRCGRFRMVSLALQWVRCKVYKSSL